MAYYGIYIPIEKKNVMFDEDTPFVFDNKDEAFKMLKKNRESRLKLFKTYDEAEIFSKCGYENSVQSEMVTIVNGADSVGNGINGVSKPSAPTQAPLVGEKPSSFRCPTSQELVKFRKNIEQGHIELVYNTVWSNPRYFVSSGDTPTILKESFRYNALHVAALAKNAQMCAMILEVVGDPKFILSLHGKDDYKTAEEVSTILLDLYLNMPEKGRSETPLHLAAKFGSAEVIEVLTSYKECLMSANSEGMLPKDIICSRNDAASGETRKTIQNLLQERFYVPVIRSVGNSMPPVIGEPFSPTQPIFSNNDLLSPDMEIKAIAGPMNKDQAETFRKRWKTPPRTPSSPASYITSPLDEQNAIHSSPLSSYPNLLVRQRKTPHKSSSNTNKLLKSPSTPVEKISRRLFEAAANGEHNIVDSDASNEIDSELVAYSLPRQSKTDMASAKKNLFFNYRELLCDRFNDSLNDSAASLNSSLIEGIHDTPGFKERNLKLADVDKGLEVIGRCLAKDHNVGWKEHWSFLGEFVDITTIEGLTKFEGYLQRKIDEKMTPPALPPAQLLLQMEQQGGESTPISKICRGLTNLQFARELSALKLNSSDDQQHRTSIPSSPSASHAYLCVEKAFQTYAKRLLKQITQQPNNIAMVNDTLNNELNRLKSLVCSYKEDLRFFAIDFRSAHSRFGHIIASLLHDPDAYNVENIDDFCNCLKQILHAKEKVHINLNNNNSGSDEHAKNASLLVCLIKFILKRFDDDKSTLIPPEILTTERDCVDVWNNEEKCDCEWTNAINNKINRSIKRRLENNYKHNDSVSDFCQKLGGFTMNDVESDDLEEDDVFVSLTNSDDDDDDDDDDDYGEDEYFTPPETPTQEFFDITERINDYDNYIFGEEPTKMDNDVMTALHNTEVDANAFPNVHKWYSALLQYSLEERASFPPPLVNSRNVAVSMASNTTTTTTNCTTQAKRLFQTPVKDILPKKTQFQLKPSVLSSKF